MPTKPSPLNIPIIDWSPGLRSRRIESFMNRPSFEPEAEQAAASVLADIRQRGDIAVADYAKRFDRADLKPTGFRVSAEDIAEAKKQVDPAFKKAARETDRNIARFAKAGMLAEAETIAAKDAATRNLRMGYPFGQNRKPGQTENQGFYLALM